jgi:hypothetical protein
MVRCAAVLSHIRDARFMFGEDGTHAGSFPPACHHCCTDPRAAAAGLVEAGRRNVGATAHGQGQTCMLRIW